MLKTDQMAEWYKVSASGSVDLSLIPSRVKPMTLKLVFTASLLDVQHLRGCVEKAGKFTCCAVGKGTSRNSPHLSVVDRWPTTPKRARTALRRFLVIGGKICQ